MGIAMNRKCGIMNGQCERSNLAMINRNATADEIRRVMKVRRVKPVLNCPVCDGEYTQNRPWQKFCSPDCKSAWHETIRNRRFTDETES